MKIDIKMEKMRKRERDKRGKEEKIWRKVKRREGAMRKKHLN